jgi:hypothetical protein
MVVDKRNTKYLFEKKYTPIVSGYQPFHNYIRPHEGLGGKNPQKHAEYRLRGKTSGRL